MSIYANDEAFNSQYGNTKLSHASGVLRRKKPFSRNGLVFGLLFRVLSVCFAISTGLILAVLIGYLNGWKFNEVAALIVGGYIFAIIVVSETLRYKVYDFVYPNADVKIRSVRNDLYHDRIQMHTGLYMCTGRIDRSVPINRNANHVNIRNRVFDLAIASFLILFLLPVFGVLAILIRSESRGPAIIRQSRVGYNRRVFNIMRFRTTYSVPDGSSDERIHDYSDVTKVGRLLRASSLNELPQLFNILIGDMSVVGPSPMPVKNVKGSYAYEKFSELFYNLKPGMVSYAYVSSPSAYGFVGEALARERYYAAKKSIVFDALIVIRTIYAVLLQRNN